MRTKLSQFNYNLKEKLVADYPTKERDESKLMVVHRDTGEIEHRGFKDLIEYFDDGDSMIFNNTKVFPARMYGKKEKTGARIEVFLLRELNRDAHLWDVLVDPARKIRVGNKLYFHDAEENEMLVAEVVDNTTSRGRTIRFFFDGTSDDFTAILEQLGQTPIPKYIQTKRGKKEPDDMDMSRYQTIYAKKLGAVAAPTAGLHFSQELMKRMEIKGVNFSEVTLHVGLGTFRSIDVEDLSKHKMDAEYFKVPQSEVEAVNESKRTHKKVCAVGTTTMRAIESSVSATGNLKAAEGWTNLFVFPPHEFSIANCMITNFHLPKSSLLIMVSAFGGRDLILEAYEQAMKKKYRFFSYGDAMLIL